MANDIQSQIKSRIEAFVAELDLLVRQSTLEALQQMLGNGGAAPARRGRPAGAARRGPGRPRGRRPADLGDATTTIVDYVRANDGQGIGAIAEATGVDLKTAKKAAAQLLAAGSLKKSGQKRGTVYHVGSGRPARATKANRGGRRKAGARRKPAAARAPRAVRRPRRVKSTDVPAALAG
jgi:hypothetical protein